MLRQKLKLPQIILIFAALVAVIAIGYKVVHQHADSVAVVDNASPSEKRPADIAGLEAMLKNKPDDVEGWQMLGWAYFDAGRYGDAASAYRKATELAPGQAVLWSSLGEAIVMASEHDPMPKDAVTAFETAISKDKADPRARYFLAVRRDLGGDHQGAIDDWFALLADTPPGAPWESDLRRTIQQAGAISKIDVAQRLAATESKAPVHPVDIATAAIPGPNREQMQAASSLPPGQQQDMVQGMVEGLESKLKSDPANVQGWIMLMRSRMTLGETEKASAAYKNAVAANPSQSVRIKEAAKTLGVPGG
ncbi:MAG: tetratricopeptide repeat protein [Alphaproteobacteria bacterium]|nr:tetratricopeptide repeat protein [Alphaproteobacteria bacterium]